MSSGPRARDRELFEILLDTEIVAAAPLEKAQREALTTGRPLWRILFRDGLCKEDDLFQILNQSVRAPVLAEDQLKSVVVPEELRAVVTPELAQRLGVLPLERSTDGRRAALAMVDPTADLSAIWNQLVRLGIAEVRRFLLHAQTFRLGFEVFYGHPYEPDDVSPPETLPELTDVEARRERREASSPRVMLDPSLAEELQRLEQQPVETPLSSARTPVLHPPSAPAPEGRSVNSQETPRRPLAPAPVREPVAPVAHVPPPVVSPPAAASARSTPPPIPSGPASARSTPPPIPSVPASARSTPPPIPSGPASARSTPPPIPSGPASARSTPPPIPSGPASARSTPPPIPSVPASARSTPPPIPAVPLTPHAAMPSGRIPAPASSQSLKPPPSPPVAPQPAAPALPMPAAPSGRIVPASGTASGQSIKPPPSPQEAAPQAGAPARELAIGPSGAAQAASPASAKSTRQTATAEPPRTPTPPHGVTQTAPAPTPAAAPIAVSSPQPVAEPLRNTARARRDVSIPELSADEFFEEAPLPEPKHAPLRASRPPGPHLGSLRPLGRELGLELAREFSKDADLELTRPAEPIAKTGEEVSPSSRSDSPSALFAAFAPSDPAQEALLATCLTLLSAYEEIVGSSRASLLSRLSQAAANRLNFTTRATREVCLVAWLHGILTARVQAKAQARGEELPTPASEGRLGFQCEDPLQSVLESLQLVLVDFMRLPGEPDVLPIGTRLVRAAERMLELIKSGVEGETLLYRIDEEIPDSEVASALRQVAESELQSLGISAEALLANPEGATATRALLNPGALAPAAVEKPAAPAPQTVVKLIGTPLPPVLPQVAWETERFGSIDELSAEGLLAHAPPPSSKSS